MEEVHEPALFQREPDRPGGLALAKAVGRDVGVGHLVVGPSRVRVERDDPKIPAVGRGTADRIQAQPDLEPAEVYPFQDDGLRGHPQVLLIPLDVLELPGQLLKLGMQLGVAQPCGATMQKLVHRPAVLVPRGRPGVPVESAIRQDPPGSQEPAMLDCFGEPGLLAPKLPHEVLQILGTGTQRRRDVLDAIAGGGLCDSERQSSRQFFCCSRHGSASPESGPDPRRGEPGSGV